METPFAHEIITWLLVLVSIILVAGITYIYTNRNRVITLLFSVSSICAVALIKLVSVVEIELDQVFLGKYDTENLPYMAVKPGWGLLIHAWHIWILPVILLGIIAAILILIEWHYKKSGRPGIEVKTTASPILSQTSITKTQRLDTFMAIDAAKKESRDLHEKLSEALLTTAAYEIKINDLNARIKTLETELEESQGKLHEEIETLNLELSAKTKENEYISNQLSERNKDLIHAQEMFEKLAALHRKIQAGDKT